MSKEKQIEEIAKIFCGMKNGCDGCMWDKAHCNERNYAEEIYNAGYRKQSEWISVNERLPEPQKLVLCIWERVNDGWNYGFARYQREDVWYVSNEGMPRVTHWMPLPEAPKGGAE
jgi:hypothetical protein